MGLGLAFKTFFRVWSDPDFSQRVAALDLPVTIPDPEKRQARLDGERLHLLSLLQRDGRLVDFLSENLGEYSDEQIGAAVRDIHRDCKEVLTKYVTLTPVMDQEEDATVEVPEGFDPGRIRLTGQVKGSAPYKGVLAHRGWVAEKVSLPERSESADPRVLAPAEVELP